MPMTFCMAGWWYGVVGHLELCAGNEQLCHCHRSGRENQMIPFILSCIFSSSLKSILRENLKDQIAKFYSVL